MEPLLTPVEPVGTAPANAGILFQCNTHLLAAPLGNRTAHIQLNCVDRIIEDRIITRTRYALLPIPETDSWTSSMAMVTQRVAVDAGHKALSEGSRPRTMENLVTATANSQLLHQQILEAIARSKGST